MTTQSSTTPSEAACTPRRNGRPVAGRPAPESRASAAGQIPNGFARLTGRERHQMITDLAHHMARRRGSVPGRELDDWLAAEKTIDTLFI